MSFSFGENQCLKRLADALKANGGLSYISKYINTDVDFSEMSTEDRKYLKKACSLKGILFSAVEYPNDR